MAANLIANRGQGQGKGYDEVWIKILLMSAPRVCAVLWLLSYSIVVLVILKTSIVQKGKSFLGGIALLLVVIVAIAFIETASFGVPHNTAVGIIYSLFPFTGIFTPEKALESILLAGICMWALFGIKPLDSVHGPRSNELR